MHVAIEFVRECFPRSCAGSIEGIRLRHGEVQCKHGGIERATQTHGIAAVGIEDAKHVVRGTQVGGEIGAGGVTHRKFIAADMLWCVNAPAIYLNQQGVFLIRGGSGSQLLRGVATVKREHRRTIDIR